VPVLTQEYILKKFDGNPPSLILHMHNTHFRFDQQDGNFGYNSEMRFILEHLKTKTVPHQMFEDLFSSGVQFYDGKTDLAATTVIPISNSNRLSHRRSPQPQNKSGQFICKCYQSSRRFWICPLFHPQLERAHYSFSLPALSRAENKNSIPCQNCYRTRGAEQR
jgi:hypothetical protein